MGRTVAARSRTVTYLTPPRLASLPAELDQLEYSSRSLVFARDGGRLLRAWGPPARPFVLGVEEAGERWRISAWGVGPVAARAAVRALFSLDHRLEEFYRHVAREPVLRGTDRTFRGLRLPRDPTLFEALVHSVIGQQLSVAAATTIKRRLLAAAASFLPADGVEVPRCPAPSELRALGPDRLAAVGLSRAKATALLGLAEGAESGRLESHRFSRGPRDTAVGRLVEEKGVGRWTAENALLRGVGRTDLFVAGDLGVRVGLDRFGAVRRDAPEAAARAWADRHYPGWGSYATLYLWRRMVADARAAAARPP
jgi:DNA-3-methyladenine glycosylase II